MIKHIFLDQNFDNSSLSFLISYSKSNFIKIFLITDLKASRNVLFSNKSPPAQLNSMGLNWSQVTSGGRSQDFTQSIPRPN